MPVLSFLKGGAFLNAKQRLAGKKLSYGYIPVDCFICRTVDYSCLIDWKASRVRGRLIPCYFWS